MDSPGLISFVGLGESIRELRELIRDLWYRNRQDRELGRLQIIQKRLEILDKYTGISSIVTERIVADLVCGIDELEQLEHEGKLVKIPYNVKRRPRKRKSKPYDL